MVPLVSNLPAAPPVFYPSALDCGQVLDRRCGALLLDTRLDKDGRRLPHAKMLRRPARCVPALFRLACTRPYSTTVLWHNPGCSKSRAALALLEERGVPFAVREYLTEPPTTDELATLKQHLGPPIEWIRPMEDAWLEHFDNATIYDDLLPDDGDILRAIAKRPEMMERPIFTHNGRSVVGRPPAAILRILDASPAAAEDKASAQEALQTLNAAVAAALARGVDAATVGRSLGRASSEVHMLRPSERGG